MPGGRLQAASDATRTEAVALVEATVLTGRENDLTNRLRKIASSLSHDYRKPWVPKQRLIIIMMIQVPAPANSFYRRAVRYLAYQALSDSD